MLLSDPEEVTQPVTDTDGRVTAWSPGSQGTFPTHSVLTRAWRVLTPQMRHHPASCVTTATACGSPPGLLPELSQLRDQLICQHGHISVKSRGSHRHGGPAAVLEALGSSVTSDHNSHRAAGRGEGCGHSPFPRCPAPLPFWDLFLLVHFSQLSP